MSYRRLGLFSLLGTALVSLLVAGLLAAGFSSDARASDAEQGCAPAGAVVNVAYSRSHEDGSCADGEEQVGWTYQLMSTGRSTANPYLGTPQQQWLAAAGLLGAVAAAGVARHQVRTRLARVRQR